MATSVSVYMNAGQDGFEKVHNWLNFKNMAQIDTKLAINT